MTDGSHVTAPGDEAAVRAVEAAYDRAWAAGDLDAVLACFVDDAVLVNPRGQVAIGAREVRAALSGFLSGEGRDTEHESVITRVSFVGRDVAVVDGHAVIRRRGAAGSGPPFEHPFTDVLVRTDRGGWAIAHVRAYRFESP